MRNYDYHRVELGSRIKQGGFFHQYMWVILFSLLIGFRTQAEMALPTSCPTVGIVKCQRVLDPQAVGECSCQVSGLGYKCSYASYLRVSSVRVNGVSCPANCSNYNRSEPQLDCDNASHNFQFSPQFGGGRIYCLGGPNQPIQYTFLKPGLTYPNPQTQITNINSAEDYCEKHAATYCDPVRLAESKEFYTGLPCY